MEYYDDSLYLDNRELSWLKFNRRVLDEANIISTPLMERLKFISIFTSNLDEFFMVRVGRLVTHKDQAAAKELLSQIYLKTMQLYEIRDTFYRAIQKDLSRYDIRHMQFMDLKEQEQLLIKEYFQITVLPILSPFVIEQEQPFPHVPNKQLHIAVMMKRGEDLLFGLIPVPENLDRLVLIQKDELRYMLIEDIILYYTKTIFHMYEILHCCIIRVTRNADINAYRGPSDVTIDYRMYIKGMVKKRARLAIVRLEIQDNPCPSFLQFLCDWLHVAPNQVFHSKTPINVTFHTILERIMPAHLKRELLNSPYIPQVYSMGSMMKQVRNRDILLSYPYEGITMFLNLIKEAAYDPFTKSIKITLYRIASQSKLAEYLIAAAENGKEVSVTMELRARFDEPNNIEWAKRLEEAGCRVFYGVNRYKVHSKICLITRKNKDKIEYITQIGTGNYNEDTAKGYTDLCLITCNKKIGRDAKIFFHHLEQNKLSRPYQCLWVAPHFFENKMISAIDQEIKRAQKGQQASIIMKMNSLTDKKMINKLVEASNAGVKIQLIVRGICCLIPGIEGLTDNIKVISIVGRFLEHSRIYCFGTEKRMKLYISSADLMVRNLRRRVEITCPIYCQAVKQQLYDMLMVILSDNVKARELQKDGEYILKKDGNDINSQEYFMHKAIKKAAKLKNVSIKTNALTKKINNWLQ